MTTKLEGARIAGVRPERDPSFRRALWVIAEARRAAHREYVALVAGKPASPLADGHRRTEVAIMRAQLEQLLGVECECNDRELWSVITEERDAHGKPKRLRHRRPRGWSAAAAWERALAEAPRYKILEPQKPSVWVWEKPLAELLDRARAAKSLRAELEIAAHRRVLLAHDQKYTLRAIKHAMNALERGHERRALAYLEAREDAVSGPREAMRVARIWVLNHGDEATMALRLRTSLMRADRAFAALSLEAINRHAPSARTERHLSAFVAALAHECGALGANETDPAVLRHRLRQAAKDDPFKLRPLDRPDASAE